VAHEITYLNAGCILMLKLKTDVIIPVYRGLNETKECIYSVVHSIDRDVSELIVINDASPEPELVDWLIAASQEFSFTLLHNATNLGFVATVNRGMQLNETHDVLLLNSDVEVSGDWLTRLREGAYQRDRVGSLTPFSNNATICSFPNFCRDNELLFNFTVKELDDYFSSRFSSGDLIDIPTGIGFCMYIRRDCLADVGYFDVESFGKGYGEENDWCQRSEKAGWSNFHQANVFVYHKGGVSFDLEQSPRIANALQVLATKHPDYNLKVQYFIKQDPAYKWRMCALWELFAAKKLPKILLVTHRFGGGVQQHIEELSSYYSDQALFLQLKPMEDGVSVNLSILLNGERLLDELSYEVNVEYGELVNLLKSVGVGHVHFHHTMGIHPKIWSIPEDLKCSFDVTVHDYYLLNGNPTLIGGDARFVGDIKIKDFDHACAESYPIGVESIQWRNNQRALIEGARHVIFPSADTCERFKRFFNVPSAIIAWHLDFTLAQPYPNTCCNYEQGKPLKVMVLGALSREKGADVLEYVASALGDSSFEFHLLGYAYRPLNNSVITHGQYDSVNAAKLIDEVSPDVVWYTALWPETYSYTLSLALEKGLPVVVPNIGAFSERVSGRPFSYVLPWDLDVDGWVDFWRQYAQGEAVAQASLIILNNTEQLDYSFYSSSYLSGIMDLSGSIDEATIAGLIGNYHPQVVSLTSVEKIIMAIAIKFPFFVKLIHRLPFKMKKAIKEMLSARSVREILESKK
jgi:GT2 family glycosyltransferase